MTTNPNNRIEDFQRRAAYHPDGVYHHSSRGWSYIPVHPFADESPAEAPFVDCWCLLDGDAALLECSRAINTSPLEPGLYARVDADSPFWPKLRAIINEPLTRAAVESAMERFVELGFPDKLVRELPPGGSLVRLAS